MNFYLNAIYDLIRDNKYGRITQFIEYSMVSGNIQLNAKLIT